MSIEGAFQFASDDRQLCNSLTSGDVGAKEHAKSLTWSR
jgi:hypothetical protein